jgi:6-phosphogluconolactonase
MSRLVVYISNAESREIGVYSLDAANGDLAHVESVQVSGNVFPLAVSPDRRFLYAALRTEPFTAVSFAIDASTGCLTQLGSAPLPDSMAYISTDRTGRYLLAASYPGNKLSVSPIGANGFVQPTQSVLRTELNAHCVITDASNRFVFCSTLRSDVVMQFRFDAATGALTANSPATVKVAPGAGPRHLALHPNNRHVYLLNELDASLYAFEMDPASGTLRELQAVSAEPPEPIEKPAAADLHLTPDGAFIYASVRASNTLAAFRVDAANGHLEPAGQYATEEMPRGFNIDPYGRYLICVGQRSNSATVYAIDQQTGALSALRSYPVGQSPNWVEIVRLP